ncbi:AmmeMemoRadiSam system protein A [Bacteroidota bacterium]
MEISKKEKDILLSAARNTIEALFHDTNADPPDYEKYPILASRSGAFVTITIDGNLRGCIGYIIGDKPLFDTIRDAATSAAMSDPRFPQLSESELDKIQIEVSILSEPFPLDSYDDIELGKHGLILEEGGRRGLLLPQVPIEHNMDRDEYLSAICNKAGLPPHYWRQNELKLDAFTATVFSEEK